MQIDTRGWSLFEAVVKKVIEKSGYIKILPDGESIIDERHIRGRGTEHEIDAFGRFKFTIPFIFPIRLIAEAKCRNNTIGLSSVRSFFGALKDISENYFVEDGQQIDEKLLSKRFTDCGAFFSLSKFSKEAQQFAYAHGIYLIGYENNPIIRDIFDSFKNLLPSLNLSQIVNRPKNAKIKFLKVLDGGGNFHPYISDARDFEVKLRILKDKINRTKSYFGITGDENLPLYPIHILSYDELPTELFGTQDDGPFKVWYKPQLDGLYFEITHSDDKKERKFIFTMPRWTYDKYKDRMEKFKKRFLRIIDIPTEINGMRRILRWQLDTEWLESSTTLDR